MTLRRALSKKPRTRAWIARHAPAGWTVFREFCDEIGGADAFEALLTKAAAMERDLAPIDIELLLKSLATGDSLFPSSQIRKNRKRPPAIPAGFAKNALGQVVPARSATPRAITRATPAPTAFGRHASTTLAAARSGQRWAPALLGALGHEKWLQISLRHVELDGFVQRLLFRRAEVVIRDEGARRVVAVVERPLLVFRVAARHVRPCVATFHKLTTDKPRLRGRQYPRAIGKALKSADDAGDVWVALVDRGRGRYVDVRALVDEARSTAALQRAGVRELVRVPRAETESAVLVLVTFEEATLGWERRVVQTAEREGGETVPAHVAEPEVLQWLLDKLTFRRGGGAGGGLSFDRLQTLLVGSPAAMNAAVRSAKKNGA